MDARLTVNSFWVELHPGRTSYFQREFVCMIYLRRVGIGIHSVFIMSGPAGCLKTPIPLGNARNA